MNGLYTIDSIRTLSGEPHERESRRKGHRVKLLRVVVGSGMLAEYVDEIDHILRTSTIENVLVGDGAIVVWTENTVYTFQKLNEEVPQ